GQAAFADLDEPQGAQEGEDGLEPEHAEQGQGDVVDVLEPAGGDTAAQVDQGGVHEVAGQQREAQARQAAGEQAAQRQAELDLVGPQVGEQPGGVAQGRPGEARLGQVIRV